MKEIVAEWVKKAEADYGSVRLLLKPDSTPHNYDLVCFLSQQCVEKYLKGYLQSIDIEFEKTHDLSVYSTWRSVANRCGKHGGVISES